MSLNNFKSLPSFIFRTHLNPFDEFIKLIDEVGDFDIFSSPFKNYFQHPYFKEAIFIASPGLFMQLENLFANKIKDATQIENLTVTLYKYFARIHQRATPFGLFSACSVGNVADTTKFILLDYHRNARIDMTVIGEIINRVLSSKGNRNHLIFYPNSSIYYLNNKLRYVEYRMNDELKKSFHTIETENNEYLQKILDAAYAGENIDSLVASIQDVEITADEAIEYIHTLIDNQLLVSNLEPKLTSKDALNDLLIVIKEISNEYELYKQLIHVQQLLLIYNTSSEKHLFQLVEINKIINEILHFKNIKSAIQVDTYLNSESTLSKDFIQDIKSGVELLVCLSAEKRSINLESFKTEFIKKYEQQQVPLVTILDSELGLNFNDFSTVGNSESPLVDTIDLTDKSMNVHLNTTEIGTYKQLLYNQYLLNNKNNIELDEIWINKIKQSNQHKLAKLPNLFSTLINIYTSKKEDSKTFQYYIQQVSAHPISRLINRFSHTSKKIENLVQDLSLLAASHLDEEVIYAEIIHLPESRLGNIMLRAATTQYEIPYLSNSAVNSEFQININDIVVFIHENKIKLKSKKLNKIIIPSLNTAYNFHKSTLPIFKFLGILQYQNFSHISWDWAHLSYNVSLPRVSFKNQILSPACWNITVDAIKIDAKSEVISIQDMIEYFSKLKVPNYILLVEGEDELIFDLSLAISYRILFTILNKSNRLFIKEYLSAIDCVTKHQQAVKHHLDLILFFNKKFEKLSNKSVYPALIANIESDTIKRYFSLGSEWLYVKIYTGEKTSDDFLIQIIYPLCNYLISKKIIKKWFFVRYKDPDTHLRIRFFNDEQVDFWKLVVDQLKIHVMEWQNQQLIHKVEYVTYQREIERYSLNNIEFAEDLFCIHSNMITSLLVALGEELLTDKRWLLVIKSIDLLLANFSYSIEERKLLLQQMVSSYENEFKLQVNDKKQISTQYRNHKTIIDNLLNVDQNDDFKFILEDFSIQSKICIDNRFNDIKEDKFKNEFVWNIIHMMCNRSFNSNQRKHELIIYQYLFNYYKSKYERNK